MTDTSKCLRAYAVGDEDVINGSVENYDFDWGNPVITPDCRCRNSCSCQNRCGCDSSCNCQNRCGCGNCCRCQNCCSCEDACSCVPDPDPEPDPDPDECSGSRCGCADTASDEDTYSIIDL